MTVIVALFVPEVADTVSHGALLPITNQLVLEVIVNDCCWLADEKFKVFVDTVKVGGSPVWVTLMVCAITPVPLIVIIAVRVVTPQLSANATDIVPLFEPEVGEMVSNCITVGPDRGGHLPSNSC